MPENPPVPPLWFRAGARVRGVATLAGFPALVVGLVGGLLVPASRFPDVLALVLCLGGFALLMLGAALTFLPRTPAVAPRPVAPPVTGRWIALNSPATRVPSHGTHAYGQTFAVDLVHEPAAGVRPRFGDGPAFRPPLDFPAFGEELRPRPTAASSP